MLYTTFIRLCEEAMKYEDPQEFIMLLGWQPWMDSYVDNKDDAFVNTAQIEKDLTILHDLAKRDFKGLRGKTGLSMAKFSDLYRIPERTVESWNSGNRESAPYILDLIRYTMFIAEKEEYNGCIAK